MYHRSLADRIFDWTNYFLLAVLAASMLFPFLYIFSVSFTTLDEFLHSELLLWPKKWVVDAYVYIFQSDSFLRSMGITVYLTVMGTLVNLFFTATFAYALARHLYGHRAMQFAVLFTMLFSAGMIPTYLIVQATGLINSIWALILPSAIAPFNLIIVRQFFTNIPSELYEAAIMDGANELRTFWSVVLPLSKPVLAAFALFYAVGHWNTYFAGILYLNDPTKWPIQVILRQIVVQNDSKAFGALDISLFENPPPPETIQMAAILMATLPILLVYPFLQKYFVKGVMVGSVKG
ncbi:carbohydrate ABC transporter permease [Paenibacillus allorhizosphaerae]|uniref:L-arabinose transport system permease protein AraQ n=1 Tax=Paenibacillus allorhizosphaerae TaxID=2849866 RepID=A0ABM8VP53_9BACL|nr:carbohydrate ABC transporter permease [Paenibacillus allorhizosphaerae]CAG7652503.1 L-arabinose transport system permease protein AraQ [Paenibacillus allorhizosphaerae]